MNVPGLYPRAKGKEKPDCSGGRAGLQQMAYRSPKKGQGLLAALESQHHQPANLTEMGQATGTAGELIKKGHIFATGSSPANTPQPGFKNTTVIQHQGTCACSVGAVRHVLVD